MAADATYLLVIGTFINYVVVHRKNPFIGSLLFLALGIVSLVVATENSYEQGISFLIAFMGLLGAIYALWKPDRDTATY